MKNRLFSTASIVAFGATLALQPVTLNAVQGWVSLSPAYALDVGGTVGGALGGEAGGSIGGTGGGAGGSIGADAGSSVGGAVGETLSGGIEAGSALAGNLSGSASGVGGGVTGAMSGRATGSLSTSERSGFLSELFGGAKTTVRPAERTSADAAARATASYEAAMLTGNVPAAARALLQISAAPVTARTVHELNAHLSIEASKLFVAALVAEAQKLQARAAAEIRHQTADATKRGAATAQSLQGQARAIRITAESRANAEAAGHGKGLRAAGAQAAARSSAKPSGAAAIGAGIDGGLAPIAPEARNLPTGRVSGSASVTTNKSSGSSRGSAEASVTGRGTHPTEANARANAVSATDAEYRRAMLRGDIDAASEVVVRLIGGPITATSVQQLNARVGVQSDQATLNAVAASAHSLRLSQLR
jgi:hypothetical protein